MGTDPSNVMTNVLFAIAVLLDPSSISQGSIASSFCLFYAKQDKQIPQTHTSQSSLL